MSFTSQPMDIVTVGGSLAGLMVSISLRRLGHNVRIMERSPTPLLQDQGAGIVLGGDTKRFLQTYDKTETPAAAESRVRLYLDKKGEIIHREDTRQNMTSWDLLYHICRANFDGLHSDYIQNEIPVAEGSGSTSYQHGSLVTKLEEDGRQVKVSYKSTLHGADRQTVHTTFADFVVIADGASSLLRHALCEGSADRTYAGYVAFRGTVPERELSSRAQKVFVGNFPFFHSDGNQLLAYVIPGIHGDLAPGKRNVNWVWYWNVEGGEDEHYEIMTDKHGALHRWTLPPGDYMSPAVWERQKKRAGELLPPQFRELIAKTMSPFVQAITDLPPPANKKVWVLNGKGALVGDSVAGFRPHTAASTNQAALHALALPMVFAKKLSRNVYEAEAIQYASAMQAHGVKLGRRSQFGHHPRSSG